MRTMQSNVWMLILLIAAGAAPLQAEAAKAPLARKIARIFSRTGASEAGEQAARQGTRVLAREGVDQTTQQGGRLIAREAGTASGQQVTRQGGRRVLQQADALPVAGGRPTVVDVLETHPNVLKATTGTGLGVGALIVGNNRIKQMQDDFAARSEERIERWFPLMQDPQTGEILPWGPRLWSQLALLILGGIAVWKLIPETGRCIRYRFALKYPRNLPEEDC